MGGSGSSTNTVDEKYNARMATLSEEQQGWARDYYQMWQNHFKPYEIEQAKANMQMLPLETNLYKKQLEGANALVPLQTEAAKEFLATSTKGVDINERMGLATQDAASAWKNALNMTNRENARMGVNPNSGRFQGVQAALASQQAANLAGARTQARVGAEMENYERLKMAAAFKPELSKPSGESTSPASGLMQGLGMMQQ